MWSTYSPYVTYGVRPHDSDMVHQGAGTAGAVGPAKRRKTHKKIKRIDFQASLKIDERFNVPHGIWNLILAFEGGRNQHHERWQSVMHELKKATFILRVNELKPHARCMRREKMAVAMRNACSVRCERCLRRYKRFKTMRRTEKLSALRNYLFRCSEWRCVEARVKETDVEKRRELLFHLQKNYFRGTSLNGWNQL